MTAKKPAMHRERLLRVAANELLSCDACADLTFKVKLAFTLMPGLACSALTLCMAH